MPAAPGRKKRSLTRQRILEEAERLIAAKGVFGFTLADIARPLGMRVPAIYKHFRSRDDVLIEVSRRFIGLLAMQFPLAPGLRPASAWALALDSFVEFMMKHPAYVRLALVDFATPGGGMDYVKLAAGGSFAENFTEGPLATMHARLQRLLGAGYRSGDFRRVDAADAYRVVKASLLIRLVFPDDSLLLRSPRAGDVRAVRRWLKDVARRYVNATPRRRVVTQHRAGRRDSRGAHRRS